MIARKKEIDEAEVRLMQSHCCVREDRHLSTVITDNFIRRLISPPGKKLSKFLRSGNVAVDLGCGPGYFITHSQDNRLTGKLYAVDSDQRSIQALRTKSETRGLEEHVQKL